LARQNQKGGKVRVFLPSLWIAGTVILAGAAAAEPPLTAASPFASASAPAKPSPAEPYQLTGVTVLPEGTRVCLYEAATQHGRWIAVGAAAGGIQVVSYDALQKQAVISVDGSRQTLVLHEAPASAAAPVATTPDAKAKEARLLTGDLLEVGWQQREAYAKAHGAASN
jgi:hypothetical protein